MVTQPKGPPPSKALRTSLLHEATVLEKISAEHLRKAADLRGQAELMESDEAPESDGDSEGGWLCMELPDGTASEERYRKCAAPDCGFAIHTKRAADFTDNWGYRYCCQVCMKNQNRSYGRPAKADGPMTHGKQCEGIKLIAE